MSSFIFRLLVLFTIVVSCGVCLAQHRPVIRLASSSNYSLQIGTISEDTAYLCVRSDKGHAVTKLDAEDFLITKDGDTATIVSCTQTLRPSTTDLAITFVLDNSGSMYHAYDSLTRYLDGFVDSLGPGIMANAMAFDNSERKRTFDGTSRESLFIASSEFTGDRRELKQFWHFYDSIRTDLTPLYEAMLKGLERIIDRRRSGDSLRREVMIVVSDGGDNASSTSIGNLATLVAVMPVTIYSVNFNSDQDGRLYWLSRKTRGEHYIAENLDRLQQTLEYLRRDITSRYKLVFNFPFRGASGTH